MHPSSSLRFQTLQGRQYEEVTHENETSRHMIVVAWQVVSCSKPTSLNVFFYTTFLKVNIRNGH